jgi:hypothetical protein
MASPQTSKLASAAEQQRRNSLAEKHTRATNLGETNARNPSISTRDILVPKLRYSSTRQRSSQDSYLIRPHNAGSKLCVSDGVSA